MSVLLDALSTRAPVDEAGAREQRRAHAPSSLIAALVVGSVVAADPSGLSPFGPAKWLLVSVVGTATVAAAFWRDGADRSPLVGRRWWCALLAVLGLAAATGGDLRTAVIGHPSRHLGLLTWLLFALLFAAGQRVVGGPDRAAGVRVVVRAAVVAAVVLGGWSTWELLVGRVIDVDLRTSRLTGPFGSAAFLAASTCLVLPISMGVALDRASDRRWRVAAALGALGTAVALIGSGTRGAWAAIAIIALVVGVVRRPRARNVLAVLAIATVAALLLAPRLGDVVDRTAGSGARLDEWRVAARVLAEHPLLGVGPEGYRFAVADGIDRDYERTYGRDAVLPDRAHSGPLDVALAGGVGAGLCYVALLGIIGRRCWRTVRSPAGGAPAPEIGLALGVVAYGLQQLVLFPLAELDPTWWVLAGVVVARGGQDDREDDAVRTGAHDLRPRRPSRARRSIAVIALASTPLLLVAGVLDVAADRSARAAVEALAGGRRDDAVALAEHAVDLRPDVVRYRLVASYVLGAVGTVSDIERALDHTSAALAWSTQDPYALDEDASRLLQLAQVTTDAADVEAALAAWRRLVAIDPHRARWQLQLGRVAALAGEVDVARQAWTIAADLSPDDGTARRLLAALDRLDRSSGDAP